MLKKRVAAIIGIVLCSFIINITCPIIGRAQEIYDSSNEVNQKSASTDILSAEGIYLPKERDSIFQKGYIKIENLGSGKLSIRGYTTTYIIVDQVKVTITLQRQVSGKWQKVTSWTASKSNSFEVIKSLNYYTTKGYKYRLLGDHYAKKGSTIREAKTVTDDILLN